MSRRSGEYVIPTRVENANQRPRKVGFELEFSGLEFGDAVRVVGESLGVKPAMATNAEAAVEHGQWGEFVVEVDSELAKQLAKARAASRGDEEVENDKLAEWVVNLTTELVPVEVVCPPIEMQALPVLDPIVRALREAGAEGTAESVLYAFGVHINPELPGFEPTVIGRYLQAYVVCQNWLVRRHRVDLTRRFTPYIDLYPAAYCKQVLAYDDDTTLIDLLDDYLRYNNTRNRALDMLPLFSYLDKDYVMQKVDDPRIKSRPTFHYRLPNCEIERGDFTLSSSWNLWCVVEELARDQQLLGQCIEQYLRYDAQLISLTRAPWHKTLEQILYDLVSA